jgi:Spy/CpxP family protein refolding chaperone
MVIFVAGVLTGGILTWRMEQANLMRRPHRAAQPASPVGWRFEFLRRAQRELDLSPEQREQIDELLKESQERTRVIMEPVSPQIHAEMMRTKQEFHKILTPDQQKRFDELLKKPAHPRDPRRPSGGPVENKAETTTVRTNGL